MTIGKILTTGEGKVHLSAPEMKALEAGKPVIKQSGDSKGLFTVTLKLTRPKAKAKRFPKSAGY